MEVWIQTRAANMRSFLFGKNRGLSEILFDIFLRFASCQNMQIYTDKLDALWSIVQRFGEFEREKGEEVVE